MEITTTWTAIRTDRARSAAHGGTALLASRTRGIVACSPRSTKQLNGVAPMAVFVGSPSTYVTDQESHPPREWSG